MTIRFIECENDGGEARKRRMASFLIESAHAIITTKIEELVRQPVVITTLITPYSLLEPEKRIMVAGGEVLFKCGYPRALQLQWSDESDNELLRDVSHSLRDYPDLSIPSFNVNFIDEDNNVVTTIVYTITDLRSLFHTVGIRLRSPVAESMEF